MAFTGWNALGLWLAAVVPGEQIVGLWLNAAYWGIWVLLVGAATLV